MGRSYGDAALRADGTLVLTERLDRFLEFDEASGVLRAEAGATLKDVNETFLPQGWFLPVTPGTQFCTLGGCLAADVHGKNHHRAGTFSAHVTGCGVILASGERVECGPGLRPDLFWATAGGMGLTGIIDEVSVKLKPVESAYVKVRHTRAPDLATAVRLLSDPAHDAEYTVAWIDCLATGPSMGRGVFMAGEHAAAHEVPLRLGDPTRCRPKRPKRLPFDLPPWALNPVAVRFFNSLYYKLQGAKGEFVSRFDDFFYPLDGILDWNRMYGKRGFVQYQYVLPSETAEEGTAEILRRLSRSGKASFLAVLKRFGAEGPGLLSFPMEGLTLALDIPLGPDVFELLDELDRTVVRLGGRLYLAKDSRSSRESLEAGYPRLAQFRAVKREVDPDGEFSSVLSRRLGI
jgi:FAD/FMN-containing dehydrogenase